MMKDEGMVWRTCMIKKLVMVRDGVCHRVTLLGMMCLC